ncbi:beta-alanine-activating enzyme [Calliphora vicina]|uniref:beta-alanine-activating enzyme n=1 Tax=Calliphora vicina TaxID=7373 RepID=UPI00325A7CB8
MSEKSYNLNNLHNYEDKPFIYERKTLENESIYSYKTIVQETTKCIQYFQNYQVENHVGIAINIKEHTTASIILLLSILNHKCRFYCLDLEETKDVDTYLRLSGVKYVISSKILKPGDNSKMQTKKIQILEDIFYLELIKSDVISFKNVRLCYTIATSGSTGVPKMVHVPYQCIEPNIKALSRLLNIQQNDVIFLGSPPTFDPFVVELFLALETGSAILITSKEIRFQPQHLLKVMFPAKSTLMPGVTIFQTTPSLLRLFGKQSIHDDILGKTTTLRCLILGGEDFPSSLELKTWLPLDFPISGKSIYNIYGITEVSCWSSIYEFDVNDKSDRVPLGKPLDDFTFFRVVDEFGNILNHNDCKGELEIGSSIRRCFIPQSDDSIKIIELTDTLYRKAGDLVECNSNGHYYYIGRTNNTIKRLGKRLCLDSLNKKVEHILNDKNMSYKVISVWHKESTKLIFYLVNSNNVPIEEKSSILKIFKQNLENHEQPDKIFYSNELPLNRHGKLDRKTILNQILSTKLKQTLTPLEIFKEFLTNVMGFQLNDHEEKKLSDLETVKRLKLSTDISFFKAGGTSFQALSLATELAEQMEQSEQQRIIVEMLLDDTSTIEEILKFLLMVTRKLENESCVLESLQNNFTNLSLKLLWRHDLKKCIDAAPSLYEDSMVAVGSHSHLLVTVNATTGTEISRLELNDRIECPVVFVTPQLALVGCYDGFLYGFNFNNGSVTWKLNVKGMIKARPLVVKNMIIVASYAEDYNVAAFDLKSLTLIWRLKLGTKGIFSSPVQISEDSVLICTLDGTYALIQAETGVIKWCQKLDTPIFSTPTKLQTSNECFLILAEVKGQISICNEENGEKLNAFQTQGNVFSGITLHHPHNEDHTFIIFGCHDKHVYCLDFHHLSKELCLLWKFSLNAAVYSTPIVISNRFVMSCSTQGLMVLLDAVKGALVASYDLKAEVFSTPICLKDCYIYVGSRDNYLYAFELEK